MLRRVFRHPGILARHVGGHITSNPFPFLDVLAIPEWIEVRVAGEVEVFALDEGLGEINRVICDTDMGPGVAVL